MVLRAPIVVVVGHVDHGKTTLLDFIRKSNIAGKEAGAITQNIGATYVPKETITEICGEQLKKMGLDLTLPGLLFIDTPGHEAFTNLRKRGGSIADLAVLIVDVNEGMQPQTKEALEILKTNKVPFIIAANKIDRTWGWDVQEKECFLKTLANQDPDTQRKLDTKVYELVGSIYTESGLSTERFDSVNDFTKQIALVPISAKTGEGVPDLMMMLSGIAQKFMESALETDVMGPGKGTILEVKELQGLGTTADVIIYDGKIKVGDMIVLGGTNSAFETKVRALLQPNPLEEIRDSSKKFKHVNEVCASAGVKIGAPSLENAVSGASLYVVGNHDADKLKQDIDREMKEIEIETDKNGLILKADALGSLEALVKMIQQQGLTIRHASIGPVNRKAVIQAETVKASNPYLGVIFAFNTPILKDAEEEAENAEVKVFATNIVYKLLEDYEKWREEEKAREKKELLESTLYPVKIKVLPGYVFRQSKPAIVGVEVLEGTLKSPLPLMNAQGKSAGRIKGIQEGGKSIQKAEKGKEVAVSIRGVTVGRHIAEGDILYTNIPLKNIHQLENEADEKELLGEIKAIKREHKESIQ